MTPSRSVLFSVWRRQCCSIGRVELRQDKGSLSERDRTDREMEVRKRSGGRHRSKEPVAAPIGLSGSLEPRKKAINSPCSPSHRTARQADWIQGIEAFSLNGGPKKG